MSSHPTDNRDSGFYNWESRNSPTQATPSSREVMNQNNNNIRLVASADVMYYNQERCGDCSKCVGDVNNYMLYDSSGVQTCSMNSCANRQACNSDAGMVSPAQTERSPTDSHKEVVVSENHSMNLPKTPSSSLGTSLTKGVHSSK